MQRFLPPLMVLLLVGGLVVRVAARPSRVPRRQEISSLAAGQNLPAALRELTRYRVDFSGVEDRWFVAGVYLRLNRLSDAMSVIWDDPELANNPSTARRFATIALEAIAYTDRKRTVETPMTPIALVTLVEGRVPWAEALLRRKAAQGPLTDTTRILFPAFRGVTNRPLEILVEEFRSRTDEAFHVAAAMAAARDPKLRTEADAALLRKVLASDSWRMQIKDVWRVVCLALGQIGDEASKAALRERLDILSRSEGLDLNSDILHVRVGLFASGDWTQHKPLFQHVLDERKFNPSAASWGVEALLHLHRTGDPEARHTIGEVWALPGRVRSYLREAIARSLLLQESLPDEDALPIGFMMKQLQEDGASEVSHMIARSYVLRRGQKDGRKAVLDGLREAAALFATPNANGAQLTSSILLGLRALLLYDGSGT